MVPDEKSASSARLRWPSPSGREIHSERFYTKEVARAAGVDIGKLQNWLTRGAIQLKGELNPGRGQSREYAPYEVARIRLMKKLAGVGIPLSTRKKQSRPAASRRRPGEISGQAFTQPSFSSLYEKPSYPYAPERKTPVFRTHEWTAKLDTYGLRLPPGRLLIAAARVDGDIRYAAGPENPSRALRDFIGSLGTC